MVKRILLQTTLLPTATDDWTIARFTLLKHYLVSLQDAQGEPLLEVTARDRNPDVDGNDPILSHLDELEVDQLWLFALDVGDGLSQADCEGITRFHQQGGNLLTTRDHQDMGLSMCALPTLGEFHYFYSRQPHPDPDHRRRDDIHTPTIDWPNYHSGRNGDYQRITPVSPLHPLLQHPTSPAGQIQFFPAHPHECGVGVPPARPEAQVIATGKSLVTGREFNLAVACDRCTTPSGHLGRVVAQSTFHHFVDYNWDPACGCPSFVAEPCGHGMQENPQALSDIQAYVKNLVEWLGTSA